MVLQKMLEILSFCDLSVDDGRFQKLTHKVLSVSPLVSCKLVELPVEHLATGPHPPLTGPRELKFLRRSGTCGVNRLVSS